MGVKIDFKNLKHTKLLRTMKEFRVKYCSATSSITTLTTSYLILYSDISLRIFGL